nr:pectin acetylesterase 8-like [Ipomoea batatas]
MDFVSRPLVLLFLLLSCSQFTADAEDIRVNPTELRHKGAVCLSGIPAAYYFAPGSDEGVHNWVVFLPISFTAGKSYDGCMNSTTCTSDQINLMQDLRLELLDVLPEQDNSSSTGFLIVSSYGHVHTLSAHWYEPAAGTNKTMATLFGDWYFDRKVVQIIDTCDHPYGCK